MAFNICDCVNIKHAPDANYCGKCGKPLRTLIGRGECYPQLYHLVDTEKYRVEQLTMEYLNYKLKEIDKLVEKERVRLNKSLLLNSKQDSFINSLEELINMSFVYWMLRIHNNSSLIVEKIMQSL